MSGHNKLQSPPPPPMAQGGGVQGVSGDRIYLLVHTILPPIEGLYCKRPIQCLASCEILTSHPLTARRVCVYPPACGAGGEHTRWVERGWGVNSSEDARHCSVLYKRVCKYFVLPPLSFQPPSPTHTTPYPAEKKSLVLRKKGSIKKQWFWRC